MLRFQKRILLAVVLALTTLSYFSCSDNDESFQLEDNQAISVSNLETLKSRALNTFQSKDFSAIFNPALNAENMNYERITEKLNHAQSRNAILPVDNYQSFKTELKVILGDDYNEAYFTQLFDLYKYAEGIAKSDLFNQKSSLEERQMYLQEVLEHAFLYEAQNSTQNRFGECEENLSTCSNHADNALAISVAACAAAATIAAIFSGGWGALGFPVCSTAAATQWTMSMNSCNASYESCTRHNTN